MLPCLRSLIGTAFVGGALASAPALAHELPPTNVTCGQTITASIRVANNLVDCPEHGLVVGAPNVTIDLNGHRFTGLGGAGDNGIENSAGFDGVAVRNGVLAGFSRCVAFSNVEGGEISGIRALDCADHAFLITISSRIAMFGNVAEGSVNNGIFWSGVSDSVLRDNLSVANGNSGFMMDNFSKGNAVTGNRSVANEGWGFYFDRTSESSIQRNAAVGNGVTGFVFTSATSRDQIRANVSSGNGEDGMLVYDMADENAVAGNVVTANLRDGIAIVGSRENEFVGNRVVGNGRYGFRVESGEGNEIAKNQASENGVTGIHALVSTLAVTQNSASRNGFPNGAGDDVGLGIDVPAGTATSGNQAFGNDDPAECQAADADCHVAP
jgi:parallel beta-helix repeat protein